MVWSRPWAVVGAVLALGVGLGLQPVGASGAARAATDSQVLAAFAAGHQTGACDPVQVPMTGPEVGGIYPAIDGTLRTLEFQRGGVSDSTSLRAVGTVRARAVANSWGVRKTSMSASLTAQATPSADHRCTVGVQATGTGGVRVTTTKRAWWVVRSSKAGGVHGFVDAYGLDTPLNVSVPLGQSTIRLLPAGSYDILASGTVDAWSRPPRGAESDSGQLSAETTLVPVGTRRTHLGAALSFVRVGHRDCANRRVRVVLTSAARTKVRKIGLYVDGRRRIVLSGSELKRTGLYLHRISNTTQGLVRAVVVTKSGAVRTMRSTSWPCA